MGQQVPDLEAKVTAEKGGRQKSYDEFSECCEDRSEELGFAIKTGEAEVAELQATIDDETARADAWNAQVEGIAAKVAVELHDLKATVETRDIEHGHFAIAENVLQLFPDPEVEIITKRSEAEKDYDEFPEWCEDHPEHLGLVDKTGNAETADLQATIDDEIAKANARTKMLQLLSGFEGKITAENSEAGKNYDKFSEWCEGRLKEPRFAMKSCETEAADLQATVD